MKEEREYIVTNGTRSYRIMASTNGHAQYKAAVLLKRATRSPYPAEFLQRDFSAKLIDRQPRGLGMDQFLREGTEDVQLP